MKLFFFLYYNTVSPVRPPEPKRKRILSDMVEFLPSRFAAAQMPYREIMLENIPYTLIERGIELPDTFRTVFMYS